MTCPKCNTIISSQQTVCHYCGHSTAHKPGYFNSIPSFYDLRTLFFALAYESWQFWRKHLFWGGAIGFVLLILVGRSELQALLFVVSGVVIGALFYMIHDLQTRGEMNWSNVFGFVRRTWLYLTILQMLILLFAFFSSMLLWIPLVFAGPLLIFALPLAAFRSMPVVDTFEKSMSMGKQYYPILFVMVNTLLLVNYVLFQMLPVLLIVSMPMAFGMVYFAFFKLEKEFQHNEQMPSNLASNH